MDGCTVCSTGQACNQAISRLATKRKDRSFDKDVGGDLFLQIKKEFEFGRRICYNEEHVVSYWEQET